MADPKGKESTVIKLVAVERGFVLGRMVEPGAKFLFDTVTADGKPRKLPKWAVKDGEPVTAKEKPKGGDLRPKDTQEAVKAKMGELSGNSV